jgi:hypothetical protein
MDEDKKKIITISFKVSQADLADLAALSRIFHVDRSEVLRELIRTNARSLWDKGQLPQSEANNGG